MKLTYTFACGLKYRLCFCCNDFGILRQVWIFYSWLNTPIDFYRHFPPRCAWHPEQHTAVWTIWGLFCPAGNLNEVLISRDEHLIDFVILGVSTFSRCTSHRGFNFPRLKLLRVSLRVMCLALSALRPAMYIIRWADFQVLFISRKNLTAVPTCPLLRIAFNLGIV